MAGDSGTTAIYMKAPFKGSVTAAGKVGWIRLLSLSFDATKQTHKEIGKDKEKNKKAATHGKFSEFTVTKRLDDASGELMEKAAEGVVDQDDVDLEIVICQTETAGRGTPRVYAHYYLYSTVLSSYQIKGGSSGVLEEIKIAYDWVEMDYVPHSPNNANAAATRISYQSNA